MLMSIPIPEAKNIFSPNYASLIVEATLKLRIKFPITPNIINRRIYSIYCFADLTYKSIKLTSSKIVVLNDIMLPASPIERDVIRGGQ